MLIYCKRSLCMFSDLEMLEKILKTIKILDKPSKSLYRKRCTREIIIYLKFFENQMLYNSRYMNISTNISDLYDRSYNFM